MKRAIETAALILALCPLPCLHAANGHDAWLRYARLETQTAQKYSVLLTNLVVLGHSAVLSSAQHELQTGLQGMLGRDAHVADHLSSTNSLVLGTRADLTKALPDLRIPDSLAEDGFWLARKQIKGSEYLIIAGGSDRGILYGTFSLLSRIAQGADISTLDDIEQPYVPKRWVNQWDNLDGSIERGYAGGSIFFENGNVKADLTRAGEYARLLASVGINGCTVNNVNADPRMLGPEFISQLERIAAAFRPWGVRLSISVDLSSPKLAGGLETFDPQDPRVAEWWQHKVDEIYRQIPDFGGFVMKADSEGRAGPSAYGRTHADAANVVARALKPHGGVLFYRAFVYNHHLDWTDPKADRAKAAYDNFHPLDGQFDENVIIQIKHGPIDFQVREPVSPLLGGLKKTNEAIELQITQEYTGQQRHLCFLVPMWKRVLDFDLHADGQSALVRDLVSGKTFHRPTGGFAGVANVGLNANWLGNPLAMANLYGFGRLAWDPRLSADAIADEWTRLTFGNDPTTVGTISRMQLASWPNYENYTGPLGAGTLTNILGSHYGPGIESSEKNGWGQWHRADHEGIGMDRTIATGTGFIGQYSPAVQKLYETLVACPDELVLFFHHVRYTDVLHSGKTVIQHIYDSHYEGAQQVEDNLQRWKELRSHIDDERYAAILGLLEYQAGHARVWRDAICEWFLRTSGIPDAKGRVGNYPNRIEAENMQLQGYSMVDVTPAETASNGKAVVCAAQSCSATAIFDRQAGWYDLRIVYFDQNNGQSKFTFLVGEKEIVDWTANRQLPGDTPNGDSSVEQRIVAVYLQPRDQLRIVGRPDGKEMAPLDYLEIVPTSREADSGPRPH
jgi:alpha-glucuronidase